jgi:sigma-B regulation protein RsbU (phosphoserine phosphatase)
VLFTDGIVELENPDGEAFGDDRLISVLQSSAPATAEQLKSAVMSAAGEFGKFHDDATVVVVTVG